MRLPPNLDLHYKEGFLKKQRNLIPPVFSDPLFIPKMAKAVFKVVKPPVVSKALPSASNREASSTPPQPEGDGLEQGVLKSEEPTPSTSQLSLQVQEQISEASNTDSDKADEPTPEEEPPRRSLKVRLTLKLLKRGHQTMASSSKDGVTPSKVWKETEAPLPAYEELPPLPHEQAGGFSAKCEKEVAKLPLPPLAHENLEALLVERPLAYVCDRDPWSLLSETFGLHSVLFDFWRLSPHTFSVLFTM